MGKIFEALEKSNKDHSIPEAKDSTFQASSNGEHESHGFSFDEAEALDQENSIDQNLVTLLQPRSIEAEQFNILKTNILFPASGKPPHSIMVTSAAPGEGKSFIAANLAISIALNIDEYALLVDCDFRKPCIHNRFGFGEVPGLSDYLSNKTTLSSVLLKTKVNKLTILPVGKPPHNPSELLSSNLMSTLLGELTKRYRDRYIIIDSPPPQLTAETNALARQVDGIVLVVKYGSTPRKMVDELINILDKEKILGIIMNWFNIRSSKYYGYGSYGKYGE